ncbi:farnesyl-diphosphate synthase [Rhizorhabdus wittichii DC-6]|jgi:farnesyl diphosphate synthase|uniref:Farnesyl-diphosphate synthase n=2 Tax=Rhizorhabdus wittichii TaxID=160791 RepID=A0A9J9LC57_RHIWR|nr:farnesyl diphosphate synthase [Rhizorhabdus wittichii]ABQ66395.1 farnesyl-diphosphate synthase [Rhizorhabdus wittichii RW1]ARR56979.1 farnesyl-diphosphate synthase [Rhizorhabdus wittichii DC-6]QTH22314.1 polyprenyl synthetase family protein [Rhizorhabdus wittichii]
MSALLASELARIAQEIDARFDTLLTPPDDSRERLYAAMRHAAIGGGKRLRPLLACASARLFAVDPECALRAGLAIEAIHVYSLIHDDLPAMDDDDLRRGRPTVHRAYDEATAILAGDGFQALAFEIAASEATHPDPFVRSELVAALAAAAGPAGMVGGQAMDMAAEAGGEHDLDAISRLQQLKTGALIGFSIEAGAILGRVPPEGRTKLRAYAHDLGLAFQIADDLLDAEGDPAAMGKAAGKDHAAGKATFVGLLGVDRARAQARLLSQQAIDHLGNFGREADLLRDIAAYVVDRDR